MEKKAWVKPEMLVIARSNPAEAVLWFCKDDDPSTNQTGYKNSCHFKTGPLGGCTSCDYLVGS